MESLAKYNSCLKGKNILLIGSGPTMIDYSVLPPFYDEVLLVNHALKVAPLFRDSRVFFLTGHEDFFAEWEELHLPNVFPIGKADFVKIKAIFQGYDWRNPEVFYEAIRTDVKIRDRDEIAKSGELFSMSNSMLLALHFLYYADCAEIHAVGVGKCGGAILTGHDPRLDTRSLVEQDPMFSQCYIDQFEATKEAFGLNVILLGDSIPSENKLKMF